MLLTEFSQQYFRSSFFVLGMVLLILTNFYANPTINQTLQFLLFDQKYFAIYLAALTAAIVHVAYPIRRGLRDFYKNHDKKTRLVFASLIFLTFFMYTPFYLIDIRMVLAVLWQSGIENPVQFEFAKNLYIFAQFVGLPLVQFYNFHIIKSRLAKEGYKTDDSLRNNLNIVFYAAGVCGIMIIVAGFLTGMLSA